MSVEHQSVANNSRKAVVPKMELPKIDLRYLKEAFKEPLNFWGMAGFAVASAFFWDATPLLMGLGAEAIYLTVVPASPFYRRYIERREKERQHKLRDARSEERRVGNECRSRW